MANKETLIRMCRSGETDRVEELLRELLSRGEDFKEFGGWKMVGGDAVTAAAYRGHVDTVAVLLEVGRIDVNSTNVFGETALIVAAQRTHTPLIEFLLSKPGIEVNKVGCDGFTALHWAARLGCNNVLTL